MIYLNGTPVNVTIFPDKTSQVWKLPEHILYKQDSIIEWDFENEGEFLHLAQLKDLLDRFNTYTTLKLKYLPYGRQDKVVSNDTTFALTTFSKLLNILRFDEVIITDPHSTITLDLIKNSIDLYPQEEVTKVAELLDATVLCYPDRGAKEKYMYVFSYVYVYGEKVRDQSTGNILSYKLIGDVKDKNVLIVDDICDGGMTFKLLAKDLLAAGAREVNLFVTHGIFSKGLGIIKESGIKRIFTQDGEASEDQTKITYRRL